MPFKLSKRETSQWMRKLAQKGALNEHRKPNRVGTDSGHLGALLSRRANDLDDSAPHRHKVTDAPKANSRAAKVPRMPADSFKARCQCGITLTLSSTDKGFAQRFIAEWWERHSGEGHGSSIPARRTKEV
jgi:hypothetical protein